MVTIRVPFFRRADFLIPIAIATALIISVSVASAVDLERGLVAYYSFDDCSAKDLSGNGNDGIIYGAKCVDGKFGKALRFDGVDDYVRVYNSASLGLSEFSLEVWFKRLGDGVSTGSGWAGVSAEPLIAKGRGESDGGTQDVNYLFGINQTNMILAADFEDISNGASHPILGTTTIQNNRWYHAVVTYDGTTWKLYLNGNLDNSARVRATPRYDSIHDIGIGTAFNSVGNPGGYFNGIIDEVRIYNRALSEEEIRALYEQGVAPRPKLAIEMDIDTSLKQGEVRKGTIRVENIGNSDAKSVEVRLFSEGLGVDVEKSYAKIPSGEAREFLFEVSANEAGTFKLSAYAEYWDDKGNKYVETADKFVHVEAVVLPTSQPTSQAPKTPEARETARPAGFYAIFASLLMAISYFLIRLKGKKN